MAIKHLLLPILKGVLQDSRGGISPPADLISSVKKDVRAEAEAVILRTLVGLVLASVVIFSLVRVGKNLELWINQFNNSMLWELLCFGAVAIGGVLLLFLTFKNAFQRPETKPATMGLFDGLNFQAIALEFVEGVLSGLEKTPKKEGSVKDANAVSEAHLQ